MIYNQDIQNNKWGDLILVKTERFQLRLNPHDANKIREWSKKQGLSQTEFIRQAVDCYIQFIKQDYELTSPEVMRLNQLIDVVQLQSQSLLILDDTIKKSLDGLFRITTGDVSGVLDHNTTYLLDKLDTKLTPKNDTSNDDNAKIKQLNRIKL